MLDQCLEAFGDELQWLDKPKFRVVRLNGILVPGNHVNLVIQEILRQLSTTAHQDAMNNVETQHFDNDDGSNPDDEEQMPPSKKLKKTSDMASELFRLRQTSFTNHVQLLSEILQFAAIDGIPVLFILDELDSFVGSGGPELSGHQKPTEAGTRDRQLLLYHLLDRVATGSSFISLVGITCNYGTMNLLEKRIKSRAEGTKFVHLGPCQTMKDLSAIILDRINPNATTEPTLSHVHSRISQLFVPPPSEGADPLQQRVFDGLHRSLRLGFDIRWFCCIFHISLSAYRHDCCMCQWKDTDAVTPLDFSFQYVWNALVAMGGASTSMLAYESNNSALSKSTLPDPRLQALRDLTGPQMTLVIAAWRILRRDTKKEIGTVALTFDKMLTEYQSFRGSTKYNTAITWKAFYSLMDRGLIRPAMDHSGRGSLQYELEDSSYRAMPPAVLGRIPLHLNTDIHRELPVAMNKNLLNCSTALREWAKKST